MNRQEIIKRLSEYFDIRELVCKHTYNKFGSLSWQFLDTELLETIFVVRTRLLNVSMTVNNYHIGGVYDERGFRCNICDIVKEKTSKGEVYLSAHCNGAAIDFDAKAMTAEDARQKIIYFKNILPYPIRLEKNVGWVHMDIYDSLNGQIITEF